jgi:hypothetical protein
VTARATRALPSWQGPTSIGTLLTSSNWSATAWATCPAAARLAVYDNFPLAQDTCIFEAGSPNSGSTITINAAYNIGTIDMSARTTNTMTLATGSQSPSIYGNWTNGTGVTFSGTGTLTFAGRGSQTITSAGSDVYAVVYYRHPRWLSHASGCV